MEILRVAGDIFRVSAWALARVRTAGVFRQTAIDHLEAVTEGRYRVERQLGEGGEE